MDERKHFKLGAVRAIPKGAEESRIIPFILSTWSKDRHGTVLNQDNWKLDNYRKNPIVAYQHNLSGGLCTDPNPDYVIGKSLSIDIESIGSSKRLVADVEFEPAALNPLAEKIFRKVLFGSLSRTSVGFLEVGHGKYGEGDEALGRENETYYFAGQELLECSIVNIPSNADAGKRDLQKRLREEAYGAIMYAFKELGGKFKLSQLENMRVCDILDALDGKEVLLGKMTIDKATRILTGPQNTDNREWRMQFVEAQKFMSDLEEKKRKNLN